MADENIVTESGQPSGADVEFQNLLKEFDFKTPAELKAAMLGYKNDIPTLKDKVKAGELAVSELAAIKAKKEEEEDKSLSAVELANKKVEELQKRLDDQNATMAAEKKSNLLAREINKVTKNATAEEADLFTEFATLKIGNEEFTNEEELQPMLAELISRWEKLGQSRPPAQTVPEGRQSKGAPAGKAEPTANKFNSRLQKWKFGRK